MAPLCWFYRLAITIYLKRKKCHVNHKANSAPDHIGGKQSFRFVFHILFRVARYCLVEVACLEKEETHEEE